jgi:hypothetical protein
MNEELIEYLKAYQEWRRGADTEQPDPTELGEKLDEAIELLSVGRLRESRKAHPLTTKEEAEKQVAEFDKVQPINKGGSESIMEEIAENEEWEEIYSAIDTIVEERDASLSENERLNNIIIELNRIIDLNEQQPCQKNEK